MLYLYQSISHVSKHYIQPYVMSLSLSPSHWYLRSGVVLDCIDSWSFHHYLLLTVAPDQQSCVLNLHIHACMFGIKPVLVFIFVIAISNHLCCLLYLHQTSIVVMAVTTAPDQQACIWQFFLSSSNVLNGYTQPAVMMVMNIWSMLLLVFCWYTALHK